MDKKEEGDEPRQSTNQAKKRKGGTEKERERKRRELQIQAKGCAKITDMFRPPNPTQATRPPPTPTTSTRTPTTPTFPTATPTTSGAAKLPDYPDTSITELVTSDCSSESSPAAAGRDLELDYPDADDPESDLECVENISLLSSESAANTNVEEKLNITPFTAPASNSPVAVKLAFLSLHPIQETDPGDKLPFHKQRVFFSKMHDGVPIHRKWISYDRANNKLFCSTCMTFPPAKPTNWTTGVTGQSSFLYRSIEKHESSEGHRDATYNRIQVSSERSIDVLIDHQFRQQVLNNRQVVERVISIILFLAKQGLAFRGHRNESIRNMDIDNHDPSKRLGNFLALIKMTAQFDPVLRQHLAACASRNQQRTSRGRGNRITFLSKNFVNNVIVTLGEMTRRTILEQVKSAMMFSLEFDSTQDIIAMDQMAICVRYVFDGKPTERLLALVQIAEQATGEGLFRLVKTEVEKHGLELSNVVGLATDGGSNLTGKENGLWAHLLKENPNVVWVYDLNHNLNIAVQHATSSSRASEDLFSNLNKIAVFMARSHNRADVWRKSVASERGTEKLRRLKKIGETRWTSKDSTLSGIYHHFDEDHENRTRFIHTVESLHFIGYELQSADSNTKSEARGLLKTFLNFEMTATAFLFLKIFKTSTPVALHLQTKGIDVVSAIAEIQKLRKMMENLPIAFDNVLQKAKAFSETMNVKLDSYGMDMEFCEPETAFPVKRARRKKIMDGEIARDEVGELQPEERFHVEVFLEVVNRIKMDLFERFVDTEKLLTDLASLDPRNFPRIQNDTFNINVDFISEHVGIPASTLKAELENFSASYQNIKHILRSFGPSTSTVCESETESQSDLDHATASATDEEEKSSAARNDNNCKDCIKCVFQALHEYNYEVSAYRNLYQAYKFALTITSTQVHCERCFSKLKILKNRLRSSLQEKHLEALMLVSIEPDCVPFDITKIIREVALTSSELTKLLL